MGLAGIEFVSPADIAHSRCVGDDGLIAHRQRAHEVATVRQFSNRLPLVDNLVTRPEVDEAVEAAEAAATLDGLPAADSLPSFASLPMAISRNCPAG